MIGLSLSFCVKDIIDGKAQLADVSKIISGTSCRTPEDWEQCLDRYRQVYWRHNPDLGESTARQLLDAGKVVQSKLVDGRVPLIFSGHWVSSEDEIQWSDAE